MFIFIGTFIFNIVDQLVFGSPEISMAATDMSVSTMGTIGSQPFSMLFSLAMLFPSLAVGARRLHDGGRTGWWLLINLIPLIGFIVMLFFVIPKGQDGENKYGPDPLA
ncbi:MAG: DUF805 domain-containing protein [Rhodobacteraceae bacterium]|nr:DUF805 domain-containing protein [Paracoccaceae bacterium]